MMKNRDGLSTVLGFVLAFAIIIAFLGVLQAVAVPEWVRGEEQDHFRLISSEFSSLAKIIALSASTGSPNTVTLDLGVEHSDYPFLITPPDMASTLKVEKLNLTIRYKETLPNGSSPPPKELKYQTAAFILTPNYMYRGNADFIYEHGYVFRKYDSANITMVEQNSFRNGSITIYIVNTTFETISSTEQVNLNLAPVSYGGVIKVDNATIEFESLNPGYWKESLKGVGEVTVAGNKVTVKVENVLLKMSEIVVSPEGSVNVQSPKLGLIVPLVSELNLIVGETAKVEVLARDEFGNPLAGVNITATVTGGIGTVRGVSGGSSVTNAEGIAVFYFTAQTPGEGKINFTGVYQGVTRRSHLDVTVTDIRTLNKWNSNYYNTSIIISPDFTWTGIYNASKIILKNAISLSGLSNDKFGIVFVIYNSTTYYTFGVGNYVNPDGEIRQSNRTMMLYENGVELFNSKSRSDKMLTITAWNNIFTSNGTDILNLSSYEASKQGTVSPALQKVKDFLQNATPSDPVNLAVQYIGLSHENEKTGSWKVEIQII